MHKNRQLNRIKGVSAKQQRALADHLRAQALLQLLWEERQAAEAAQTDTDPNTCDTDKESPDA